MGRGGGRGRGGGGGARGRGGFRGRGRSAKSTVVSRKDATHLRHFGESHPANTMGDFKNPSKKIKLENHQSTHQFNHQTKNDTSEESDDSEQETTPYNELMSVLTGGGKKGQKVQIVSESEDEDESEPENEDINENNQDKSIDTEDVEVNAGSEALDNLETIPEEDLDPESTPDETVIEEAESDSEAEQETDSMRGPDPFCTHFQRELSAEIQTLLGTNTPFQNRSMVDWPLLERVNYSGLQVDTATTEEISENPKLLEVDTKLITKPPTGPVSVLGTTTLESLHIKGQMHKTIPIVNEKIITKGASPLTPLQQELLTLATSYYDLYYPRRSLQNEEEVRIAYCIHVVNHILKTRTRILHHNSKMQNKVEVPEEYRDQGFVRPKVLILTPFKESALRIVKTLISLALVDEKGNVQNKKRFVDEYGGETLFLPKTNPKPDDYMAMFQGNVDDNFKIGLAITKKSVKLYTGFYASDVIIGSPLGLRMVIGAEGEKDRDYDFLSSIELVVMDQADVFLMQNWDHLLHLLRHLNLQPVTTHGTDFGRIRPWALDGLTKFYCQTLLFSSLICPEHLAVFSKIARNYAGVVKSINPVLTSEMGKISLQLPHVFQQFDSGSIAASSDARFDHFVTKVLPNYKSKLMSHTLIFISSYFDFVRLRNHLRKEEESFVQICEYTKDKKIARARDFFFHGQSKFLLYTERAHFFRRFRLKGIGHIVFYQLPQHPHFYSELCNFMQESYQNRRVRHRKNSSVNVVYCQYDTIRLAGLVGTTRANQMLASDKMTHAFVTEAL